MAGLPSRLPPFAPALCQPPLRYAYLAHAETEQSLNSVIDEKATDGPKTGGGAPAANPNVTKTVKRRTGTHGVYRHLPALAIMDTRNPPPHRIQDGTDMDGLLR